MNQGFRELLGCEDFKIVDDTFTVTLKIREEHLNSHQTVHGSVFYSLSNIALEMYVSYIKQEGVGMDGNIKYYRPAFLGETIIAKVIPRKVGKRIGVFLVEVINEKNKLLSESSFTILFQ